jgi:hypothetical protein
LIAVRRRDTDGSAAGGGPVPEECWDEGKAAPGGAGDQAEGALAAGIPGEVVDVADGVGQEADGEQPGEGGEWPCRPDERRPDGNRIEDRMSKGARGVGH